MFILSFIFYMSVLDKIKMMRMGDRVFLSWFVIVFIGGFVFLLPTSDTLIDYLEKYGYGAFGGGLFTIILFLVLIPYGIYRLNRKRKQKVDDSGKREE
jgi:cbb3-type cytochrome oxidase subunit 3